MDLRVAFAAVYIVVDLAYVLASKKAYDRAIGRIGAPAGHKPGIVWAAGGAYLAMGLAWLFLVAPAADRWARNTRLSPVAAGAAAGFLWSLALYGVFNGSLYAMFRDWKGRIVIRDMAWGLTWGTILTAAYAAAAHHRPS